MKQTTKVKKVSKEDLKPVAYGYGHRKEAKARVWLRRGTGKFIVNGKEMKDYFDTEITRLDAATPFRVIPAGQNYDVEANVSGGGKCGQAGAVKIGFARALLQVNESLREILRQNDLLTIDSRQKERKKYGQRAARRKFQFVKR
jgi:small subunit ribosomal protein S9